MSAAINRSARRLPDTPGGLVLILNWLGMAIYGGFQIKPWLASTPTAVSSAPYQPRSWEFPDDPPRAR